MNNQKPKTIEESSDIAAYEAQITELTNDLQRTRADFENYRKQIDLQKEGEKRLVRHATVRQLLPLLDDIDRALTAYQELAPLAKSLEKTAASLGLSRIPSVEDTEFNPDLHDAVSVTGDGEKELIAETLLHGYYYEDSVLRPAMVKVIKK